MAAEAASQEASRRTHNTHARTHASLSLPAHLLGLGGAGGRRRRGQARGRHQPRHQGFTQVLQAQQGSQAHRLLVAAQHLGMRDEEARMEDVKRMRCELGEPGNIQSRAARSAAQRRDGAAGTAARPSAQPPSARACSAWCMVGASSSAIFRHCRTASPDTCRTASRAAHGGTFTLSMRRRQPPACADVCNQRPASHLSCTSQAPPQAHPQPRLHHGSSVLRVGGGVPQVAGHRAAAGRARHHLARELQKPAGGCRR